jgi:hypothetical protein
MHGSGGNLEKEMTMKTVNSIWIVLLGILLSFSPVNISAHGIHFHSLCELAQHIDEHIATLDAFLHQSPLDQIEVQRESREIVEHAKQYQSFARTLIRKGDSVREAKILESIGDSLIAAARQKDLDASLDIMKQLRASICLTEAASK